MRKTGLYIILGTNGTGKTTFCRENFVKTSINNNRRCLIVTPDEIEWNNIRYIDINNNNNLKTFQGTARTIPASDTLKTLYNFENGLLIFDDCRVFMKPRLQEEIERICIRRRQKSFDIVVVAHGFTRVPPSFFPYMTHIILFKTTDSIKLRKQYLLNYNELEKYQKQVNSNALTDKHYNKIIEINNLNL